MKTPKTRSATSRKSKAHTQAAKFGMTKMGKDRSVSRDTRTHTPNKTRP
jgi:hypothetical protein